MCSWRWKWNNPKAFFLNDIFWGIQIQNGSWGQKTEGVFQVTCFKILGYVGRFFSSYFCILRVQLMSHELPHRLATHQNFLSNNKKKQKLLDIPLKESFPKGRLLFRPLGSVGACYSWLLNLLVKKNMNLHKRNF